MAGAKPDMRAVIKVGEKRWTDIGAAWRKDTGNYSVSLNVTPSPNNGRYSFLLVPNGKKKEK